MKNNIINYKIGRSVSDPSPIPGIQKTYESRYKGKNKIVTQKLKEHMFNTEPSERVDKFDIIDLSPRIKIIEKIRNKVELSKNKPPTHKDLYSLLANTELLILAHSMLRKNEGATTEGPDKVSIDKTSLRTIEKVAEKLKNHTFKWKGTRYVEIPRPGKKPRPLGIPDYDDKLVQFAIKIILEAIYDPLFKEQNLNHGFISHRGCHNNIKNITQFKNQGLHTVIEGDIQGAFDNVNHEVLIGILSRRIKDQKFLKLIYSACKAGKVQIKQGIKIYTKINLLGTPQGSIMSPIMFNIYMNEFDEFVTQHINKIIIEENKNKPQDRNLRINKTYKNYKSKMDACRKAIKILRTLNKSQKLDKSERKRLKDQKLRYNRLKLKRYSLRYWDDNLAIIRMFYSRYCDDFLLMMNCTNEFAEKIKFEIAKFLKEKLKLTLSPEKTLITDLREKPVYFLGFRLYMAKRNPTTDINNITQRSGSEIIQVGIHHERRLKNLVEKKYATPDHKPREAPHLISFEPQEIIDLYNSIIDGLVNYYYGPITRKSELNRYIYILHYSCLKTLAAKFKISIRKIMIKYGWPEYNTKKICTNRIRLVWKYSIDDKIKMTILRNYTDAMDQGKWVSISMRLNNINDELLTDNDYWSFYKLNWRTKFKYSTICSICGKQGDLESHHIRKIGGLDNQNKMLIMQKLNRKQIIVCKECHNKIHAGTYNGIRLKDLSDVRTLKSENLMLSQPSIKESISMARKGLYVVSEKFANYLNQKYNIGEKNLKVVRSKPIILDLYNRKVINHKEKAQQTSIKHQKPTLKKILRKV